MLDTNFFMATSRDRNTYRFISLLGASANARDSWNYTPLHEAAVKGKTDVCVLLLQHGADVTVRNSENKTPLDVADANAKPVLTGRIREALNIAEWCMQGSSFLCSS